jgi:hypothetical protein
MKAQEVDQPHGVAVHHGRRRRLPWRCSRRRSASHAAGRTLRPQSRLRRRPADRRHRVTGSRIKRDGFDASTPVAVVSEGRHQALGHRQRRAHCSEQPQFVASTNGGATSNTVPGGTADVNLRGFGATRNLVLVNGRRFAIAGPEQTTDLNTIPTALIERTEIVTGGSSAVYGSDAITGVVNFIMRDDFEGVEGRAQIGLDSSTQTFNKSFTVTAGGNFARIAAMSWSRSTTPPAAASPAASAAASPAVAQRWLHHCGHGDAFGAARG